MLHLILHYSLVFFLFFLFLFVVKWVVSDEGVGGPDLYPFNGHETNQDIDLSVWENAVGSRTEDCTAGLPVVDCDLSDQYSCFRCKQPLYTCRAITTETTIHDENTGRTLYTLMPTKPGRGICSRIEGDLNGVLCSRPNGGRMLLTDIGDGRFVYQCVCLQPDYFTKTTRFGNCTTFVGCAGGGQMDESIGWSDVTQIRCKCPTGRKEYRHPVTLRSTCIRQTVFEVSTDWPPSGNYALADRFIDAGYLERVRNGLGVDRIYLPNPCLYDALTGDRITSSLVGIRYDRESINTDKYVAWCWSDDPLYTPIQFDSDYLAGNDGRYANGMVRVFSDISTRFTDEWLLETHTAKREKAGSYPTIRGVRSRCSTLLIQLPYLSAASANVGGDGRTYEYAPFYANYAAVQKSFIYMFEAQPPPYEVERRSTALNAVNKTLEFGHRVDIKVYPSDSSSELIGTQLIYDESNAMGPNDLLLGLILYPGGLLSGDDKRVILLAQDVQIPDNTIYLPMGIRDKAPLPPTRQSINPYTQRFSGLYLHFTLDNTRYTKSIYPQDVLALKRYRTTCSLDPSWSESPDTEIVPRSRVLQSNDGKVGEYESQKHNFATLIDYQSLPETAAGFSLEPFCVPRNLMFVKLDNDVLDIDPRGYI